MKKNHFLMTSLLIIWMLGAASCDSPAPTPSPADIQTAIAATLTAAPTITSTPTIAIEATKAAPTAQQITLSPTIDPGTPMNGTINVEYLNMRTGPSTFFEIIKTFVKDTELVATTRTPDKRWVEVEITAENETTTGWMFAEYLNLEGSISQLGLEEYPVDRTISGQVVDENQNPIELVAIAFVYSDDDGEQIANTISDQAGQFTMYLPEDMFGIMDVQVVNPTCESSIVDENCQVSTHILLNNREFISIPQDNQEITFVYETAGFTLTGTVTDNRGDPVEDINVTALRDDGAVSYGYSDVNGEFSLPISEGIWDVYAVEFNSLNEGEHVTVTVADTIPDPIDLSAPD